MKLFELTPISWDASFTLAFCPQDCTIRRRVKDVPGLNKDFSIDTLLSTQEYCCDKNGWRVPTGRVITYFGGLSEAEQNEVLPIVATNLIASLLVNAKKGRITWKIDEDSQIRDKYLHKAEGGDPFSNEELEQFKGEIVKQWEKEKVLLADLLPADLMDSLHNIINSFTKINSKGIQKTSSPFSACVQPLKGHTTEEIITRLKELANNKKSSDFGSIFLKAKLDGYLTRTPRQNEIDECFGLDGRGTWSGIHDYMVETSEKALSRANMITIFDD